jgi:hypothetical protein
LGLSNDKSKKNSGKSGPKVHLVSQIGPVFQSQVKLGLRPLTLAQPIYYAGPKKGYKYEFWRLPNKTVEIRYVPKSVKKAGAKPNGKQYLIIATYPFSDAYNRLKKKYKNIGVTKNGAYIVVRPGLPTNILMAWPKVDYEVEVFDPNPQKAAAIAESGQVGPVS